MEEAQASREDKKNIIGPNSFKKKLIDPQGLGLHQGVKNLFKKQCIPKHVILKYYYTSSN